MYDRMPRDYVTSNVLAWTTQSANVESASEEEGCDADEPPDSRLPTSPITNHFKRTPIRRDSDHHHASLLTKAFQSHSEEESFHPAPAFASRRRRSITSNFSLASTTDLTCETGITTPARTSSPSPHLPDVGFVPLVAKANRIVSTASQQPPAVEKKRCISFACLSKPKSNDKIPTLPSPKVPTSVGSSSSTTEAPKKKSCIKFACNARPPKNPAPEGVAVMATTPVPGKASGMHKEASPKHRSPSTVRSFRSTTPRRQGPSPAAAASKKYLDANFGDLQSEGSRFHEFASDGPQEDDWIRRDEAHSRRKLTIYDTLAKENAIRKLGKEAEEEADMELEEELNDVADDDEAADGEDMDDEDEDGDEDIDLDEDDLQSGYGTDDDDASDGYNTDNEVGFADSEDDDDDLVLWTTHQAGQLSISGPKPVVQRQNSLGGDSSDSSVSSKKVQMAIRGRRSKPIVFRPGTPELPDSTDFVCGTLDEDRPLEDAYISCMAARKREKQIPVPQDIDPSFPNSEPEDEIEEFYKHGQGDSDDQIWLHGELEDIHHEQDRVGRRKKTGKESPRRLRSPPPKRPLSPAPKTRGRSPRRLNGQTSPRRLRSPPPPRPGARSPVPSLVETTEGIAFKALAFGPGLTYTKSLPKAPAIFAHTKGRKRAGTASAAGKANSTHVRGAIDIVKGLEQKRLRRKEKFYQKYCNNRARKEKAQERLPPGRGAEMMKEIGLGQARVQGNYVISL